MSTDRYVSPLSERYASKEMQYIFSPDMKFRTWRRLWIALAETEKELGLNITQEQIDELKAHKDDILEVIPRLTTLETEASLEALTEKSFGDVFKEFYRRERGTEADDEVLELLLSLVLEEDKQ